MSLQKKKIKIKYMSRAFIQKIWKIYATAYRLCFDRLPICRKNACHHVENKTRDAKQGRLPSKIT